jgi:hypothetical protein
MNTKLSNISKGTSIKDQAAASAKRTVYVRSVQMSIAHAQYLGAHLSVVVADLPVA